MKRNTILLFCFILLFNFVTFAQRENYETISNYEFDLFKDVISSINDSSFIISPLLKDTIGVSMLDTKQLISKYGFTDSLLRKQTKDKFQIGKNDYFEVADIDSIMKFKNFGLTPMIIDSSYVFAPYYYFVNKVYHKKCICTFSKPIISKNNIYAIVEYFIGCGADDGMGKIILVKKTNNEWAKIDDLLFFGS